MYDEFRRQDVEVAGISVDSPWSHRVWASELGIDFPILSDFERTVLPQYDAVAPPRPFISGIGRYCAFLVDARGILRGVWYPPESGGLTPVEEVLEAVRGELSGQEAQG